MTTGPALIYNVRASRRPEGLSAREDVISVFTKQLNNTAKRLQCSKISRNLSINCVLKEAQHFAPVISTDRLISVETLDAYRVHPVLPTEKRWIPLSHIDIIMPDHDILACVFYAPQPAQTFQSVVSVLRTSLAEALVAYYPLAGRLTMKRKEGPSLHCNDSGVEFEEASTDARFDDIDCAQPRCFDNLAPRERIVVNEQSQEELPFSVKVTRFRCGGIVLGCRFHHRVVDAAAATQFLISWSQISRGLTLLKPPFHHRSLVIKPRDPPQPNIAEQICIEAPMPPPSDNDPHVEVRSYYVSKKMIEELKKQTQADAFSSVTAFFWRASVRARKVALLAQKAHVMTMKNMRSILRTPQGLFGNVLGIGTAEVEVESLLSAPLGVAAGLVAESVAAVDRDVFQSVVDMAETRRHRLLENTSILMPLLGRQDQDSMLSSSMVSFPIYKINFGWGFPCFSTINPSRRYDGFVYFVAPPPGWGGGLVANIECLNATELDIDHELAALASKKPQFGSMASILTYQATNI